MGTVAVLYTNKKNLLWHLGKDKESRTVGLFLFLAAPGATANTAGLTTVGVFLDLCVHGFTFYNEKIETLNNNHCQARSNFFHLLQAFLHTR